MRVLVVGVLVATLMFLGCGPSPPEESKALASSSSAKKAPEKKRSKKRARKPTKGPEELAKTEKKGLPVEEIAEPPEQEELKEDDSQSKKAEAEEGKFGEPEKAVKIPKRDGKLYKKIDPKEVGLHDLLEAGSEDKLGGYGGMGFKGTGTGGLGDGGAGRIYGLGKIDTGGGKAAPAKPRRKKRRVAKMKLGGLGATGYCKKRDISTKVKRRSAAIRACYEKVLRRKPRLAGKVMARWQIGMDGRVSGGVSTGGSMPDGSVKSCVGKIIKRIRFASPEGGICMVRWPFVFTSL